MSKLLFNLSITVFEILHGGILPNVSGRYKEYALVGLTPREKAPQRDTGTVVSLNSILLPVTCKTLYQQTFVFSLFAQTYLKHNFINNCNKLPVRKGIKAGRIIDMRIVSWTN